MTRLQLINWHNFQNNIIDFKNITYLLGVNAVGKTTIMDAIRYCLTTNKDFNTAGNKKSGRTLLGSVHQKQRAEDSYLRAGHTVSYIGTEFFDEYINKFFVIVARVESETPNQSLKGVTQDWYITKPGYKLEDIPFFTKSDKDKKPTSREGFKFENRELERASNQTDARKRICRVLGIGDSESLIGKKFNEVFHMGTSLEDIKNIRDFICKFILPDPKVDIDFLQQDMHELERLQEVLEETQNRERLLLEINEKLIEAKNKLAKLKINEMLVAFASYQNILEEKEENSRSISEWESSININNQKLQDFKKEKERISNLLDNLKNSIADYSATKQILILENENKEKKKELEMRKDEALKYKRSLDNLFSLQKRLNNFGFEYSFKISAEDEEVSHDERIAEIKAAERMLEKLNEQIENKKFEILNEIKILSNRRKEVEEKIKSLKNGQMYYPDETLLVKNRINEELRNEGRKSEVKLLCELLEMEDVSWQDALESYLNTQRFNIIVSPNDYLIAKRAFISLKDNVKSIGLVDTRNLKNEIEKDNSNLPYLADKVNSENIYAKEYVNFILKDIICCDSADTLEEHKRSITKDRLRFQNFCLQRLKKQEHFIGLNAIKTQLFNAEEEQKNLVTRLEKLNGEKENFDKVFNDYNKFISNNNFNLLEQYFDSNNLAKSLDMEIKEREERIEDFKKNPLLISMYNQKEEYENMVNNIIEKIIDITAKNQNFQNNINNKKQRNSYIEEEIAKLYLEYENILNQNLEYENEVKKKYQEERKFKSASAIAQNFRNQKAKDEINFNNYQNQELIPLQQKYNNIYSCDYLTGIDGAEDFQTLQLKIQNFEIEKNKNKLEEAKKRCEERFKKEVLSRMKADIQYAQRQFKQINKVMENLRYGEESYRFHINKSKDKELGLFYDIIMDKDNQQIDPDNTINNFLVDINQLNIYKNQVEDFMNRIMCDVEEHARENISGEKSNAKRISTYADYRTYLDYDIIVTNSSTKQEAPLSKVSGEGSGGENQAPFYIAICASLLQIYEQNQNGSIKLILLDEAFNNMTSDRIEPMMNMFKELNLQLIIIATIEKATSIIPFSDIAYSIIKHGVQNIIEPFEIN